MREQFEKLPEISRMVACDEIKWCGVYNWYRTDNTDANSIYHIAWLNGAWYSFQEQQKKIESAKKEINDFFDNQTMTPSPREYANKLADLLEILK